MKPSAGSWGPPPKAPESLRVTGGFFRRTHIYGTHRQGKRDRRGLRRIVSLLLDEEGATESCLPEVLIFELDATGAASHPVIIVSIKILSF